jgi:hypothetical protein
LGVVFLLEPRGHISGIGAFPLGAGELVIVVEITSRISVHDASVDRHVDMVSFGIIYANAVVSDLRWAGEGTIIDGISDELARLQRGHFRATGAHERISVKINAVVDIVIFFGMLVIVFIP